MFESNKNNMAKSGKMSFSATDWLGALGSTVGKWATGNECKFVPKSNVIRNLDELFTITLELGSGATSRVVLAKDKKTGKEYAVKQMAKSAPSNLEFFKSEYHILSKLKHTHIAKFHGCYIDNLYYYLVSQYCSGGMLTDCIKKLNKFSEKKASNYIKTITDAIKYCHSKNIVHCDLKPHNIVFDKPNRDSSSSFSSFSSSDEKNNNNNNKESDPKLMIIDFGLALDIKENEDIDYVAGTISYMAPENFAYGSRKGKIMRAGDLWSIGVITYLLVCGEKPFYGKNEAQLIRSILLDGVDFPDSSNLSKNCQEFILNLLDKDATERFTASEALNHVWLNDAANNSIVIDDFDDKFEYFLVNVPLENLQETEKKLIDQGLHRLTKNKVTENAIYDYLIARGVDEKVALKRSQRLLKMLFIHDCDQDSLFSINISETLSKIISQPSLIIPATGVLPKLNENVKNKKNENGNKNETKKNNIKNDNKNNHNAEKKDSDCSIM